MGANFLSFVLGFISGVALFMAGPPIRCWPLALVGLIPWLSALQIGVAAGLYAGLGLVLGYVVPVLWVLRFPVLIALGFAIWQTLLWSTLSSLGGLVFKPGAGGGAAILLACLATVIGWIDYAVVPVYGTAQCFTRVLTGGPRLIQFARVTGMPGLVFVTVAFQALAWGALRGDGGSLGLLIVFLGLVVGFNEYCWQLKPVGTIRVAALGWARTLQSAELIREVYPRALAKAVREGAVLLVSPEAQFSVDNRPVWVRQMGRFAEQHGLCLAAGFFDNERNDNRILFLNATGEYQGEYAKTHLVPLAENYRRGSGQRNTMAVGEWTLGGVICQDDNFTDLTRGYGREAVHVLAIPTHDWRAVKEFHLENCRLRAIETGAGIVRAASYGISAINSPRGEILRRLDHYRGGDGVIVADLELRSGVTLYSRLGDWLVWVCAAAAMAWWVGGGAR